MGSRLVKRVRATEVSQRPASTFLIPFASSASSSSVLVCAGTAPGRPSQAASRTRRRLTLFVVEDIRSISEGRFGVRRFATPLSFLLLAAVRRPRQKKAALRTAALQNGASFAVGGHSQAKAATDGLI